MKTYTRVSAAIIIAWLAVARSYGATNTWDGSSTNDWFDAGRWTYGVPGDGDDAIINSGAILLTNSTSDLASFTLNGGTLICSNWTTQIKATNVTLNGGAITLPSSFTNNVMSNRVWIVSSNFIIQSGAAINADGLGYSPQNGLGAAVAAGADLVGPGAGHGGFGGNTARTVQFGGATYGSTNAPLAPGSGGGRAITSAIYGGGPGGGAIRIEGGTLTVNGTIKATGANGRTEYGGGGSGGSIYITCGTFGGDVSGLISANGGNSQHGDYNSGPSAGGGGGRISVIYTNVAADTKVRFSAAGGAMIQNNYPVELGTLYFPDTSLFSTQLNQIIAGRVIVTNFTSWTVDNLTLTNNGIVALGDEVFALTVKTNLVINSGAGLTLGRLAGLTSTTTLSVGESVTLNGGTLTLGGDNKYTLRATPNMTVGNALTLTNSGKLYVYSGITNGAANYGGLVTVTGNVTIAPGSWIYPFAHPTNGGAVLFRTGDVFIQTNAGFNADGGTRNARPLDYLFIPGYMPARGPGAGGASYGAGSGYGGKGANSSGTSGGATYGLTNAPLQPGSGGGRYNGDYDSGGPGGGLVRVKSSGSVTVNGTITAEGADKYGTGTWGGGGAGGGIFINCRSFSGGSNAVLRANAGDGGSGSNPNYPGGGGGGRIAVWYQVSDENEQKILNNQSVSGLFTNGVYAAYLGTTSVSNGTSAGGASFNGDPGTVVFLTVRSGGMLVKIL